MKLELEMCMNPMGKWNLSGKFVDLHGISDWNFHGIRVQPWGT